MKLDLGVVWAPRNPEPWRRSLPALYADLLEEVRFADQAGFHSVWLSEHHFVDDDYMPDVFPMLGAIAAVTKQIRLGSYVLLAPLHHPVRLAEQAAIVDNLSNGRLELGLGVGYRSAEFTGYGVPADSRGQLFDEVLDILHGAWLGDTLDHSGIHWQFRNLLVRPQPVQSPPTILIGGMSKPALRRALRFPGAGVAGRPTVRNMAWFDEVAARHGRDSRTVDFVPFRYVWVAKTSQEAKRIARPFADYVITRYAAWANEEGLQPHPAAPDDQLIAGSPEEVADALGRYVERRPDVSVKRIALQPPLLGVDHVESMKTLELMAAELLPRLGSQPNRLDQTSVGARR